MPGHRKLRSAVLHIYFASLPFNIFTSPAARREKYKPMLRRRSEGALAMPVQNCFAGRRGRPPGRLHQASQFTATERTFM